VGKQRFHPTLTGYCGKAIGLAGLKESSGHLYVGIIAVHCEWANEWTSAAMSFEDGAIALEKEGALSNATIPPPGFFNLFGQS
jgi:hypothetical protein